MNVTWLNNFETKNVKIIIFFFRQRDEEIELDVCWLDGSRDATEDKSGSSTVPVSKDTHKNFPSAGQKRRE
jgi:hypothetical protein